MKLRKKKDEINIKKTSRPNFIAYLGFKLKPLESFHVMTHSIG
jgi:hypothetical protein